MPCALLTGRVADSGRAHASGVVPLPASVGGIVGDRFSSGTRGVAAGTKLPDWGGQVHAGRNQATLQLCMDKKCHMHMRMRMRMRMCMYVARRIALEASWRQPIYRPSALSPVHKSSIIVNDRMPGGLPP